MKLITREGISEFCKKYKAKLIQGSVTTPHLQFHFPSLDDINKVIWDCRDKKINYYSNNGSITFEQKELVKLLPKECSEEKRVWAGRQQFYLCEKMDHQHLSNCVGYLEILLVLKRISKKDSEDYMSKLAESVVPELEERFKGEILPYKPHFPYEEELYKEYKKIAKISD